MIFEVCCGSFEDCINAKKYGADRIELNSALFLGGLTPSFATFKKAVKNCDIKIICMVRNRGAGFNYNNIEKEIMFEDAEFFLKNNADGIAFGFLNEDRTVDIETSLKMVKLIHSYNKEAVFHRAFDMCDNPYKSIEELIDIKVDRILTSGQQENIFKGSDLLKSLQEKYGEYIEILAGGGLSENGLKEFIKYTGIKQLHSSCRKWTEDKTSESLYIDNSYGVKNSYEIADYKLIEKYSRIIKETI